jgi:opacity protein-like surface antigen
MRKIGFILTALLLFAGLASAQVPTSGNIFFGYSYQSTSSSAFDFANSSRANLNGWEATVEGKVFPFLGFVADASGHYGSQNYPVNVNGVLASASVDAHETTVMFGPRVSASVGKFRPFAEALFGVGHVTTTLPENLGQPSDTSFAWALGGGLDYRIIRPIAWRFQGDYVETAYFGATQDNVRLSTGIVLRF